MTAALTLVRPSTPSLGFRVAFQGERGAYGDLAIAETLTAAFPDHRLVTLHPNTMAALRRGEVIDIPFASIEVRELERGLLFAGKSERALVEMLRDAGLVGRETAVDWTEYEKHERDDGRLPERVEPAEVGQGRGNDVAGERRDHDEQTAPRQERARLGPRGQLGDGKGAVGRSQKNRADEQQHGAHASDKEGV